MIRLKYEISESTIQVEEYVDEMNDCTHCQDAKQIFFLCLDVNEINDFINVKMRNRYGLSGCE